MNDTISSPNARPTYGDWRRPRSPGIGDLGTVATLFLFCMAMLSVFAVFFFGPIAGLVTLLVLAAIFAPLLKKNRRSGQSGYQRLAQAMAWRRYRRRGGHLYQGGPLSRTPDVTARPPGLAAQLEVSEALDAHALPFVVIHHPRPGHVSTVIQCSPEGTALVDDDQIDLAVANWGAYLADLGQESSIVGAQVTVQTSPDPGVRLRKEVERRFAPDAPSFAVDTMREVIETLPDGAAEVSVWVTITWTRARGSGLKRRTLDELVVDIGQRLPELRDALKVTGAGYARSMTSAELASVVRRAYDPQAAQDLAELADGEMSWLSAGPTSLEQRKDCLLHDGATSMSWAMVRAPEGAVQSRVLERLHAPHRDVAMKRVTHLYRPHGPWETTQIVQRDLRTARFQASQPAVTRARDTVSMQAAARTEQEEARGAGLVRFSIIVTATVWDADDAAEREARARARSVVESLGSQCRVDLHLAYRAQAATFLAGLPLGLVLPAHVAIPKEWQQ